MSPGLRCHLWPHGLDSTATEEEEEKEQQEEESKKSHRNDGGAVAVEEAKYTKPKI